MNYAKQLSQTLLNRLFTKLQIIASQNNHSLQREIVYLYDIIIRQIPLYLSDET